MRSEFMPWVNELLYQATQDPTIPYAPEQVIISDEATPLTRPAATPTAIEQAIKIFLEKHFNPAEATEDGMFRYTLNGSKQILAQNEMIALTKFMIAHHYDGELHTNSYKKDADTSFTVAAYLQSAARNLYLKSFLLQITTLLECTAIFSAIWEKKGDFNPNKNLNRLLYVVFIAFAYASLRNVHYYANKPSHKPMTAGETEERALDDMPEALKENEELQETLLSRLTTPHFSVRLEQEIRSWLGYFIKLGAAAALFFAELPSVPLAGQLMMAALAGTVEGVDTAFTQVAIGNEHRSQEDLNRGTFPPSHVDRGLGFAHVANFTPIPWLMAKVGPAMWSVVKARAAVTFMRLIHLSDNQVPGGLYGIYAIAALSAAYVSTVFSQYNVDEKLGKSLPTQRDFQYAEAWRTRLAQGVLGALPTAAAIASTAHSAGFDYMASAVYVGLPAQLVFTLAIGSSKRFADLNREINELRFVSKAATAFDRLHITDKITLGITGALIAGLGAGMDVSSGMGTHKIWQFTSGAGQVLFFTALTGIVAHVSRITASQMRYTTAQMFLYAAAMLTWTLNFAISMDKVMRGENAKHRPQTINSTDFGMPAYLSLVFGSLLLAYIAGLKDHEANATKVDALIEPIPADALRPSYLQLATSSLWCNLSFCTRKTDPASEDTDTSSSDDRETISSGTISLASID